MILVDECHLSDYRFYTVTWDLSTMSKQTYINKKQLSLINE